MKMPGFKQKKKVIAPAQYTKSKGKAAAPRFADANSDDDEEAPFKHQAHHGLKKKQEATGASVASEDSDLFDPFAGEEHSDGTDFSQDGNLDATEASREFDVPVTYQPSHADHLPWKPVKVSYETKFDEAGFFGLEEIPAGSYEIEKKQDGGFSIKMKASTPAVVTSTTPSQAPQLVLDTPQAALQPVAGKKRSRAESSALQAAREEEDKDDEAPAAGKRRLPSLPSTRASLPLDAVVEEWGFLELDPRLLQAIARLGFPKPTAVQVETIPPSLRDYKDIVGAAATGSGKTLAYALPIIHRLLERRAAFTEVQSHWKYLPCLILAPTRELAVQVCDHIRSVLEDCPGMRVANVVGGLAVEKQVRILQSHPDIIVATPGRFWDLIRSGHEYLSYLPKLQFLVLDEADRLCEKGHFEALNHILHALRPAAVVKNTYVDPVADKIVAEKLKVMDMVDDAGPTLPGAEPPAHSRRQTFLFSATLGVSTAQSARDGAQALVAAQAQQRKTDGDAAKIGKAKMRKALDIASKLTPVEALMARVGTLGKPAVIKVDSHREPEVDDDDRSEHSHDTRGTKATKATAITTKTAAGEMNPDANVALPPGLRLCRITCVAEEKDSRLYYFLLRYPGRTLIFVNAIAALKRLLILCSALKLPVTALHAHMQQRQRLASLEKFRNNPNGIMVATDVAARGLDIPSVQYVLHYGLPQSAEMFVHRCGRTARAATSGLAAAIIDPKDQKHYVKIMNVLGMESGLPEFPVDVAFMRRIISRISLARKLTAAIIDTNRESSQQFFVMKTAKDSGLIIDDDLAADLGLDEITRKALLEEMDEPPTEPEPGAARAPKRRRTEPEECADIDDSGSIDADTIADYKQKKKQGKKELVALRRELDCLLKQPLAPSGTSLKYITSNPLLNQSDGPMAATGGVRLVKDTDASAPAARRGSALVAPKVLLPSLAGADPSRHTSIAAIARETAIDTLAHKGKHVFVATKRQRTVEPKRR